MQKYILLKKYYCVTQKNTKMTKLSKHPANDEELQLLLELIYCRNILTISPNKYQEARHSTAGKIETKSFILKFHTMSWCGVF